MLKFSENVSLGAHCTYLTGGKAERLAFAYDICDLICASDIGATVIGRGSNILVGDKGVRGAVVLNRASGRKFSGESCECESGALMTALAREYASMGMTGLEWAYGLPGSVGGAVIGNAGAFGGCMADCVESVTVRTQGKTLTLSAADCKFGYRRSAIPGTVLSVRLKAKQGKHAEIAATCEKNLRARRSSQPQGASAGSVFKSVGSLPAAVLIESAELKGRECGGAVVSPMHANFIINRKGANSGDVLCLMNIVRAEVYRKFGVKLEREIRLIGDFF